jgi:transmembrane sensor
VGQQRTVTLSDESVVTLNTNSILDTHFTADLREVHLRKGEAHFSVSHDRARPFVVHAGMSAVRAVGTAFDVRIIDSDHVDVIVTDGRVEVQATVPPTNGTVASPPGHTISAMSILEAGSRLRIDTQGVVVQAISGDVQSKSLAWRQGIVVFDGQRLSETIAELSRYTSMNIVVTDPRIADLPVGGRFRISEIDDFFAALEKAFPVVVRHVNDNLVYIEPRS